MENMNKLTGIKAYVDGFYYLESEEKCETCGTYTDRVNVETGLRQCVHCDNIQK